MVLLNAIFENSNKFYFEGEIIRIKLEVNLEKSSILNNVIANFVGLGTYLGNVEDKENKTMTAESKIKPKNTTEIYFDDVLPIFLCENKESAMWSKGTQVFMFAYQLPHNVPSSIESTQGFVRYSVNLSVDIDGVTVKKTEHFTLLAKTDVSTNENAHLPGIIWEPENEWCIILSVFCKGNRVRTFLHISKQGYVPGECLFINAEITNLHRCPVEWVKATLVQFIKFCGSKSLVEKRNVAEITRGCILPRDTQTWKSESVLIPAIPPTTRNRKRIISVKYKLLFHYKPSWRKKPVELSHNIFVGTVRLSQCKLPNKRGEGEGLSNSEVFNGSNLEPCVFGPHSIDVDGDVNDENESSSTFSPLYPIHSGFQ